MAFLGTKFNPNSVEPSASMEAFPPGDYKLAMTASESTPTKAGDGKYLKCEFVVLDGPQKGRKVWMNLNLWNKNAQAVEIAWRQMGDLCRACGYYRDLEDSSALHNVPFSAKVGIKKSEGYRDQNEIVEFYAKPGGAQPQAAVAAQPVAGSTEATAQTAAQPTTQAQPAGEAGVPPWLQGQQ